MLILKVKAWTTMPFQEVVQIIQKHALQERWKILPKSYHIIDVQNSLKLLFFFIFLYMFLNYLHNFTINTTLKKVFARDLLSILQDKTIFILRLQDIQQ